MINTISIKSSRDFTRAFRKGKSSGDRLLVVYIFSNRLNINRIGISIGKKVGKSVHRNRVKRLIRENYRLMEQNLKTGFDIIFMPRPDSKDAKFNDFAASMNKSFKRLEIFAVK